MSDREAAESLLFRSGASNYEVAVGYVAAAIAAARAEGEAAGYERGRAEGEAMRRRVLDLASTLDREAHDDDATRAVAKWETADRIRRVLT